ncbi:MAG: hypothetical protein GY757_23825 [bacterium]|nr:hypothetical protein [bacterium]
MNENTNKPNPTDKSNPNPLEKTEALETDGQLNLTREETAPGEDIGPPGDTLFSTTVLPRIEGTVPNIRLCTGLRVPFPTLLLETEKITAGSLNGCAA